MKALWIIPLILLASCYAPEIPEDITVTHEFDFLLAEAMDRLRPFGDVGGELTDPLVLDDEILVCGVESCVTVGDFRAAARFLLDL